MAQLLIATVTPIDTSHSARARAGLSHIASGVVTGSYQSPRCARATGTVTLWRASHIRRCGRVHETCLRRPHAAALALATAGVPSRPHPFGPHRAHPARLSHGVRAALRLPHSADGVRAL